MKILEFISTLTVEYLWFGAILVASSIILGGVVHIILKRFAIIIRIKRKKKKLTKTVIYKSDNEVWIMEN